MCLSFMTEVELQRTAYSCKVLRPRTCLLSEAEQIMG